MNACTCNDTIAQHKTNVNLKCTRYHNVGPGVEDYIVYSGSVSWSLFFLLELEIRLLLEPEFKEIVV